MEPRETVIWLNLSLECISERMMAALRDGGISRYLNQNSFICESRPHPVVEPLHSAPQALLKMENNACVRVWIWGGAGGR